MVKPLMVTPSAESRVETSCRRCILMVLFAVIIGSEDQLDAEFAELNGDGARIRAALQNRHRKFAADQEVASLPLVVTRFGSARICRMLSAWSALMNAPRFKLGLNANRFSALRDGERAGSRSFRYSWLPSARCLR